MNIHSIRAKITLIFILAFLLVAGFFIFYLDNAQRQNDQKVIEAHEKFAKYFREVRIPPYTVEGYLKRFDFVLEKKPLDILNKGKIISRGIVYDTILYQNRYYFHVKIHHFRKLFRDLNHYQNQKLDYLGFAFVLLLFTIIYIWLLKSLNPLLRLKDDISLFAKGDLDIDCASNKKDEIALVANEFNHAVEQIRRLVNSRQLFLRTLMHELKTPIAKGRIVSELVEEKQKNRLIVIFEKLDYLINDFSKIEELLSNNYNIQKHSYKITLLVNSALDLLLIEENSPKIQRCKETQTRVLADYQLFSMVIKNLVDNALKYSEDGKVKIIETKESISIYSKAKPLKQDIEYYYKPFHNEEENPNQGMGLGLYIVKAVLDMHQMRLEYKHSEGENCFKVVF